MNYKLLMLALIMTGSLGAMHNDGKQDIALQITPAATTTQVTTAQSTTPQAIVPQKKKFSCEKMCTFNTDPKINSQIKIRLFLLGCLSTASLIGFGTDMATTVAMDNNFPIHPRIAEIPGTATPYPYYLNNSCDTETITCIPEEEIRFQKICDAFNARNVTRKVSKRQRGGGDDNSGVLEAPYHIKNLPADCTAACKSVSNPVECEQATIENGQVAISECNDQKRGPSKYAGTAVTSTVARLFTVLFTVALLLAETQNFNN